MSIFDLDDQGSDAVAEHALANRATFDEAEVGFFDESAKSIGMGIMRGGAKAARAAGVLGAAPLIAYEKLNGDDTELSDSYFSGLTGLTDSAVDYWTPTANSVGTAGRVLGNLAEIVLPLAAGGGNPSLLMGSVGANTAYDLVNQGVDPSTAVGVGLVDSAAVGIGFRLPFLGKTFAAKAATGAAGSLALGVGATAADRAVLEGRGYEQIAEQYNPLDVEARTVDLLMGVAFGGIAHLQGGAALRSEREAALTALNAKHFQNDTAPGRPSDERDLIAHQSALEQAIADLNAERPVDVGPSKVIDSTFREVPRDAVEIDDVRSVLDELGIKDAPRTELDARDHLDNFGIDRATAERILFEEDADAIPDGWFIHGRSGMQELRNDATIQATKSPRIANQYAGKNGSVFLIRPNAGTRVADFSSERSVDMDSFVETLRERFEDEKLDTNTVIGQYVREIETATGKDAELIEFDDFEATIRRDFAPDDIVDTARAYDGDIALLEYYHGGFPDMVITPDGAVVLPGAQGNVDSIRLNGIHDAEPAVAEEWDIPRSADLSPADQLIESRYIDQLRRDPEAAMRQYAELKDAGGGKILNTDVARELSPDYLADRTKSAAVHEPSSALIKKLYQKKLAEQPAAGEQPLVVFSAGGAGAGKTTGLELMRLDRVAQIVYDSNMNSLESSVKRIEQALAAGKQVQILYTYRDPVEALTGGALPRAMRQEAEFGSGRTVPLSEYAKTHIGASKVVRQIADKYKDNQSVQVVAVDNSLGRGRAKASELSVVPEVKSGDNQLLGKLHEALDTEFKAGRISEAVYRGFKGEGESQPQGLRETDGRGGRQEPEHGSRKPDDGRDRTAEAGISRSPVSGKSEESVDLDVLAAERSLESGDIQIDTGETDADGNPKTVSARELLEAAKEEVARAKSESKAFDAAVVCFLGG